MAGFEDIGGFFAGNRAGNEMAYQKGLALGANTQNALAEARKRVRENTAIERLQGEPDLAAAFGLGDMTDATVTALAADIDPTKIMDTRLKGQEAGFRDVAGSQDPAVTVAMRNRALMGVSSAPQQTLQAVGSKGYTDIMNPDMGVMKLPFGTADAGGGQSAAMQLLTAMGLVDENDRITDRELAMDIYREMSRAADVGGVPGEVDLNPFRRRGAPAAAPPGMLPGAPPASLADELAPPMPPMPAPAVAPPAAAVRPPAAPIRQTLPTTQVVDNIKAIEAAKKVGGAAGEATAALPDSLADIDKFANSVNDFVAMPGFEGVYGNVQGQPVVKTIAGVLSQDIQNAQAALANLDAQAFGVSIQKMRGLGQLSNAEGLKVTNAFTRAIDPRIDEAEARDAWQEVLSGLELAKARAATKAGMAGPTGGAPAAAAPAVGVYADPAKEARYQAWKASQGLP
jgi:hypothetical protein